MKKVNKLTLILLVALTALFAVSVFGFTQIKTAKAYTDYTNPYSYYFEDYSVTYDVAQNRKIAVTEKFSVHFTGYQSTGIIKDIPVNGGEQVKNLSVYEIINGTQKEVWYDVYFEDSDFLSVDIGDSSNKTDKVCTYLLTYNYCLTKAQEGKDALSLNVIGLGRNCKIDTASVTLILPSGYKSGSSECIIGDYKSEIKYTDFTERTDAEKTVIELKGISLGNNQGITFNTQFESGVLTVYSDATPYLFLIPAFILLAVIILLKLFVFNKNTLMPVVNYEAPNKMDPLLMGKLIDNKIDDEDVTSLIFYWASKGYIKINLDNKDDPTIIRIMHTLPEPCPSYERLIYNSMFQNGDTVKPSQLKYKFYNVVERTKATVNKKTNGLYDGKSFTVSIIFAVLSTLLLVVSPIIIAITQISVKLLVAAPIIAVVPVIFIYLLTQALMYYRLKLNKNKFILMSAGIAAVCLLAGAFYVIAVPASVMGIWAKILLFAVCCLALIASVLLISRTKDYTEKLNDVIGFKNFIMLAEKDQLEMMLEDDPQFYYHVLPYAQVLGVTDKWEEKFAGITMQPPQWATGNVFTTYLEFRLINNILRNSMKNISSGMVSRPSSSGSSGGGRGGFGGGHVGGGHGGGGFRGR